ncbi:MAG: transketolase C-terminal domain-containing protein, partial [Ilumatobacteraceae bacterium]
QVGELEVGEGFAARKVRSPAAPDVCIVAVGKMLEAAEKAALLAAERGVEATVWDARAVSPLDPAMVADAAAHDFVVTVEDGIREGGIGFTIADAVCALDPSTRVDKLGVPTKFLPHDPNPNNILARCGLDAESITARVMS